MWLVFSTDLRSVYHESRWYILPWKMSAMLFMLETVDALLFCSQWKTILPNRLRKVRFAHWISKFDRHMNEHEFLLRNKMTRKKTKIKIKNEEKKNDWKQEFPIRWSVLACSRPFCGHIVNWSVHWENPLIWKYASGRAALYIHINWNELLCISGWRPHIVKMKSSLRLKYHLWIIKIVSGIAHPTSYIFKRIFRNQIQFEPSHLFYVVL